MWTTWTKKRSILALLMAVVLITGCGGDKKVVIDAGGVGYEKDVMITEAVENTRLMDQNAQ
jgi:hypothetical protein